MKGTWQSASGHGARGTRSDSIWTKYQIMKASRQNRALFVPTMTLKWNWIDFLAENTPLFARSFRNWFFEVLLTTFELSRYNWLLDLLSLILDGSIKIDVFYGNSSNSPDQETRSSHAIVYIMLRNLGAGIAMIFPTINFLNIYAFHIIPNCLSTVDWFFLVIIFPQNFKMTLGCVYFCMGCM